MKRLLYEKLVEWKNSKTRKPLILNGARQVGKTWLLTEFAKNEYQNFVYINCENNATMQNMFFDYDVKRIIRSFEAVANTKIEKGKTLIVVDEIQEIKNGINCLKYFYENANEYHIAVAGSTLGISLHSGGSFPVGKVDYLTLYPLSFKEFLLAIKEESVSSYLDEKRWNEYFPLKENLIEHLREYYYIGGMPEAVLSYVNEKDFSLVRKIQNNILLSYKNDFSKHIPPQEYARTMLVWNSIPSQLAKENKKFVWGALRKGARAKDFENSIEWLRSSGLVHKVVRVKKFSCPLKFYEDKDAFKLFFNDVGLLGAFVDIPLRKVITESQMLTEYKGAFTEQYFLSQFLSCVNKQIYYYTNENSTSEIDFVVQNDDSINLIEVKAEISTKAKSLKTELKKDESLTGLRFSMNDYKVQDRITNIPLYLVPWYLESKFQKDVSS